MEAGYGAKFKHVGASRMMSLPFMQEAKAMVDSATMEAVALASTRSAQAAALEALAPVHKLEARQNRITHLASIASGEARVTRKVFVAIATHPDGGEEIEVEEVPSFRDQIAAAKLLGMMYGDFVMKQEIEQTNKVVHKFVHIDNGRGPLPAGVSVQVLPSHDFEICQSCGEGVSLEAKASHVCEPKKLASGD